MHKDKTMLRPGDADLDKILRRTISQDMSNNDEFVKLTKSIREKTFLLSDIETTPEHFLVENKLLRDTLQDCLMWLENAPFDYSNGNSEGGVDEGEYYGGRGHCALVDKIKTVLGVDDE
jgi:hypothetical protein